MNDKAANRLFVIAALVIALALGVLCWYNWPNSPIRNTPSMPTGTEPVSYTTEPTETTTQAEETIAFVEPMETYPTDRFDTSEEPSQFSGETHPSSAQEESGERVFLGEYQLTAYCACVSCCGKSDGITATGTIATAGRTIAVDPSVIPYGSKVEINGNIYIAEDCGGAIKDNRIDIFFDSHGEAVQFGVQRAQVYLLK
jgi:3D (Asp-Asp-Asp) domain-containing protein